MLCNCEKKLLWGSLNCTELFHSCPLRNIQNETVNFYLKNIYLHEVYHELNLCFMLFASVLMRKYCLLCKIKYLDFVLYKYLILICIYCRRMKYRFIFETYKHPFFFQMAEWSWEMYRNIKLMVRACFQLRLLGLNSLTVIRAGYLGKMDRSIKWLEIEL